MKNKKRIGVILISIFLVFIFTVFRQEHVRVTVQNDEISKRADSLFLQLQKQDSLIKRINVLEDSLLKAKTDTIIKIKKEYENKASYIVNLPIDGQVKLLTRNLSKDTIN